MSAPRSWLLMALAGLAGCSTAATPGAPPCPVDAVLPASAPEHGMAIEDTPAGHCLAQRAEAGDIMAALRLGDFYRTLPGTLPLIDRNGREVHWYRLAGDHGSPLGGWQATRLLDLDRARQVPNDALAYLFTAVKGRVPGAADYLIAQWQAGRIDPGKLWGLRGSLARPGALPETERAKLLAGLNAPAKALAPE